MSKLLYVLLTSHQLKKTIVQRSFKFNIPLRTICKKIGVDYKLFMVSYINSSGVSDHINEKQFLEMLDILGIDVRFQFIVDSDYTEEMAKEKL